jgi:hypothetical protein
MPRFALSVTLGFFVAAGLAHAAHVHKDDTRQNGERTVHCGLCIQFERAAVPPATPRLPEPARAFLRIAVTRSILPAVLFHSFPYDARGPPLTA